MFANICLKVILNLIFIYNQSVLGNTCDVIVNSNNAVFRGCNEIIPTDSLIAPKENFRQIFTFKGMPYAVPPVRELRFRKPMPLIYNKSTEVNATQFGRSCKQPPLVSRDSQNYIHSSEDCLFINVFTPSLDPFANLPVLLYIHGGGLLFDSARQVPGEQLTLRDVVVVTFNYRLGVFGFLCTASDEAPGNVGLWDQAMAMNWTKNNIQNFGGNPNEVTLIGQSAGAVSVSSHIVSNVSKDYFKRAVIQSGSSLTNVWLRSKEYSTRVAKRFAKFVGCNPSTDYVNCLRNKTSDELLTAQSTAFLWNLQTPDSYPWVSAIILVFVQCFEDEFLPQSVHQLLNSSNFNKDLHLLLGHTTLEAAHFLQIYDLFKGPFGTSTVKTQDTLISTRIAKSDIQKVMINNNSFDGIIAEEYTKSFNNLKLLTPNGFFERQRLRASVVHSNSDYFFVCPTVLFGKYLASDRHFRGKVFQYYLTYANNQSTCRTSTWCTNTHYDDVPLVFGQPFYMKGFSDDDKKMSTILMDIFTTFAKTNTAPVVNGHKWPAYSRNSSGEVSLNYMELNTINLGQTYYNKYNGNNGFNPLVIQNCRFWEPILRSLF